MPRKPTDLPLIDLTEPYGKDEDASDTEIFPKWSDEDSNPWRKRMGGVIYEWFYLVNDREWWKAMEGDLVYAHGEDSIKDFLSGYWDDECKDARSRAIWGTSQVNKHEVTLIYNTAKMADSAPLEETRELFKKPFLESRARLELGEWLLRVIREGHPEELTKLASLVKADKGIGQPSKLYARTQRGQALDAFMALIFEKKRLPSRVEILNKLQWDSEDPNQYKPLTKIGLQRLPD